MQVMTESVTSSPLSNHAVLTTNDGYLSRTRRSFLRTIGLGGLAVGLNLPSFLRGLGAPHLSPDIEVPGTLPSSRVVVLLDVCTDKICTGVAEWSSSGTHHIRWFENARHDVPRSRLAAEECRRCLDAALKDAGLYYGVGRDNFPLAGPRWDGRLEYILYDSMPFSYGPELTEDQRRNGVLVLGFDNTTTYYMASADDKILTRGLLAVGNDDITDDIATGLGLIRPCAEKLKRQEGAVGLQGGPITMRLYTKTGILTGFKRETLNAIIEARVRRILGAIRARVQAAGVQIDQLGSGVYLTGGASLLQGIDELAGEVFGIPACLPS
jgi:hypothetical protein